MNAKSGLLTVGAIARQTGQPLHRVRYALGERYVNPIYRHEPIFGNLASHEQFGITRAAEVA
jgi:hypothetical protein